MVAEGVKIAPDALHVLLMERAKRRRSKLVRSLQILTFLAAEQFQICIDPDASYLKLIKKFDKFNVFEGLRDNAL